jgi:hypothetical protein
MRQYCMVMSPPQLWPLADYTTNYRPVVSSERAPQDEEQSNCPAKERKKKNLVMGPKEMPDGKTDRTTDRRSQHQLNSTELNCLHWNFSILWVNEEGVWVDCWNEYCMHISSVVNQLRSNAEIMPVLNELSSLHRAMLCWFGPTE